MFGGFAVKAAKAAGKAAGKAAKAAGKAAARTLADLTQEEAQTPQQVKTVWGSVGMDPSPEKDATYIFLKHKLAQAVDECGGVTKCIQAFHDNKQMASVQELIPYRKYTDPTLIAICSQKQAPQFLQALGKKLKDLDPNFFAELEERARIVVNKLTVNNRKGVEAATWSSVDTIIKAHEDVLREHLKDGVQAWSPGGTPAPAAATWDVEREALLCVMACIIQIIACKQFACLDFEGIKDWFRLNLKYVSLSTCLQAFKRMVIDPNATIEAVQRDVYNDQFIEDSRPIPGERGSSDAWELWEAVRPILHKTIMAGKVDQHAAWLVKFWREGTVDPEAEWMHLDMVDVVGALFKFARDRQSSFFQQTCFTENCRAMPAGAAVATDRIEALIVKLRKTIRPGYTVGNKISVVLWSWCYGYEQYFINHHKESESLSVRIELELETDFDTVMDDLIGSVQKLCTNLTDSTQAAPLPAEPAIMTKLEEYKFAHEEWLTLTAPLEFNEKKAVSFQILTKLSASVGEMARGVYVKDNTGAVEIPSGVFRAKAIFDGIVSGEHKEPWTLIVKEHAIRCTQFKNLGCTVFKAAFARVASPAYKVADTTIEQLAGAAAKRWLTQSAEGRLLQTYAGYQCEPFAHLHKKAADKELAEQAANRNAQQNAIVGKNGKQQPAGRYVPRGGAWGAPAGPKAKPPAPAPQPILPPAPPIPGGNGPVPGGNPAPVNNQPPPAPLLPGNGPVPGGNPAPVNNRPGLSPLLPGGSAPVPIGNPAPVNNQPGLNPLLPGGSAPVPGGNPAPVNNQPGLAPLIPGSAPVPDLQPQVVVQAQPKQMLQSQVGAPSLGAVAGGEQVALGGSNDNVIAHPASVAQSQVVVQAQPEQMLQSQVGLGAAVAGGEKVPLGGRNDNVHVLAPPPGESRTAPPAQLQTSAVFCPVQTAYGVGHAQQPLPPFFHAPGFHKDTHGSAFTYSSPMTKHGGPPLVSVSENVNPAAAVSAMQQESGLISEPVQDQGAGQCNAGKSVAREGEGGRHPLEVFCGGVERARPNRVAPPVGLAKAIHNLPSPSKTAGSATGAASIEEKSPTLTEMKRHVQEAKDEQTRLAEAAAREHAEMKRAEKEKSKRELNDLNRQSDNLRVSKSLGVSMRSSGIEAGEKSKVPVGEGETSAQGSAEYVLLPVPDSDLAYAGGQPQMTTLEAGSLLVEKLLKDKEQKSRDCTESVSGPQTLAFDSDGTGEPVASAAGSSDAVCGDDKPRDMMGHSSGDKSSRVLIAGGEMNLNAKTSEGGGTVVQGSGSSSSWCSKQSRAGQPIISAACATPSVSDMSISVPSSAAAIAKSAGAPGSVISIASSSSASSSSSSSSSSSTSGASSSSGSGSSTSDSACPLKRKNDNEEENQGLLKKAKPDI
eukprot:g6984.t1